MVLRGLGELEGAIMRVVWSADPPVTVREVVDELAQARPVAYTTILTVMDRLVGKGMLVKHRSGKAHTYEAKQSRAAYTAALMARVLDGADDTTAVLLRFVEQLPPDEASKLRDALDADPRPATPGEEQA
jgi:predicted transcriptional regulator